MLQTLRAAHLENKNWQQELFLFLRNYRATPHSNTGVSPAELLFGRKLVVKLSELVNTAPSRSLIADTNRKPKGRMKAYADTHVRRLNIAHWQLETRFSSVNHVNTNYYRLKQNSIHHNQHQRHNDNSNKYVSRNKNSNKYASPEIAFSFNQSQCLPTFRRWMMTL